MTDNYIYGRNPLLEQLAKEPEKVEKIFLRENLRGSRVNDILGLASQNRIPVSFVPGSRLREMVGPVNDQGVVAQLSAVGYLDLHEWLDSIDPGPDTAILLLDEIGDPHNFGAILRSAAAAGMAAVLVPKHRQAPISATVVKTSAGTAGRIPVIRVGNLNQTIRMLRDHRFWIAGLDAGAERVLWEMESDVPMAIVIGNEHQGIRRKTAELCDFLYSIPMHHGVESLNASVSAALACYEWRRKRDGSLQKGQRGRSG